MTEGDEDDAAVAAGTEFYELLDEDDQAAIDAWVASQVDDYDDSQIDDQAIVDAWVANQLNDDDGDDSKGCDDNGNLTRLTRRFCFENACLEMTGCVNDVASGDDAQAIFGGDDADEDDAAVAAGIEYYQSLDEVDQAAIDAWVADQLNDDGGDDSQGGDDQGN
ncbi:Aste57867_670 [Aphanomyces stellatus]|uniref:Aste57867_670 protein n=1 Tax=Aphanomyces stellatus TaxID=120398 RepID=A0A485K7B4_9STRA|nr:hypothetical protein As57867_000669 [Aphanomyces stellatus]VFT77895.1 Aste57867_670 [Aphanomyces stellatus]